MKTRILIVDSYAPFRSNLAQFLASLNPEYDIVGEAATDVGAMEKVRCLQPDVVFVDIDLLDRSGLVTAQAILQGWANTAVVMITDRPSEEYREAALAVGAAAFLDKPALVKKLPKLMAELVAAMTLTAGANITPDLPTMSPFQP